MRGSRKTPHRQHTAPLPPKITGTNTSYRSSTSSSTVCPISDTSQVDGRRVGAGGNGYDAVATSGAANGGDRAADGGGDGAAEGAATARQTEVATAWLPAAATALLTAATARSSVAATARPTAAATATPTVAAAP